MLVFVETDESVLGDEWRLLLLEQFQSM